MADNSIPGNANAAFDWSKAQAEYDSSNETHMPLTDGFDWEEQWSLIVRLTTTAQRLAFLTSLPVEPWDEDFRLHPIEYQNAFHDMVSEHASALHDMAQKLRVPARNWLAIYGRVAERPARP